MGSSRRHAGDGRADLRASLRGGSRGSARGRGCLPHVCAVGVPEGCFSMRSPPGMCRQGSLPMPIRRASSAPQNPSAWGITPAPLAEGLEQLGWVQPRRGGCTPGVSLRHGSPCMAELGVPPGHAPVTSRGQGARGEPCCCQLFACPGTQAARHHCSQPAGAVPACGHPGSGTHRRSHRL